MENSATAKETTIVFEIATRINELPTELKLDCFQYIDELLSMAPAESISTALEKGIDLKMVANKLQNPIVVASISVTFGLNFYKFKTAFFNDYKFLKENPEFVELLEDHIQLKIIL